MHVRSFEDSRPVYRGAGFPATMLMITALLFALPATLLAVGISGMVVDDQGYGLGGANVLVEGTRLGATTNLDGEFMIAGVPDRKGEVTLVVSLIGYKKKEVAVDLAAGSVKDLQIPMALDPVALEDVTLTEKRSQSGPVTKEAERVEVITSTELKEQSSDGGLLSALAGGAGLDTKACALCGSAGIGMQGLDPSYTEINVDGLPVLSGLGALYGLDGIMVSDLEQVEISKGGTSGESGSNAMAGAVNLVSSTHDGPISELPRGEVSVMGGETGRHRIGATTVLPVYQAPLSISGTYAAEPRKIDRNNDGLTDTPSYTRFNLQAKHDRPLGEGELTARVRAYGENRFAGETHWTEDDRGSTTVYGRDIRTRRVDTGLRYESETYNWGAWSVDGAFVRHEQESWYGTTPYNADQTIGIARLAYSRVWDARNNTLVRVQYRHEDYRDNLRLATDTDRLERVPGLLLQHNWNAEHNWKVQGSVLSEVYREDGFVATPRLSVSYSPAPAWVFLAAGGTGYRIVNLFSLDKAAHAGFDNVYVPEDLEAERSVGGSLTTQYRAGGNALAFDADVTGFYTRFDNKVIVGFGHAHDGEVAYLNADNAFSRGVEVQLGFAFAGNWSLRTQGTLSDVQYYDGSEWRRQQMHSLFTGGAKLEKRWTEIGVRASLETSVFGPQKLPVGRARSESPTYATVDVGVSKSWDRFSIALRGENLNNFVQPDEVFVVDPATGERRLDAAMIYGPQLGRTVTLTLSTTFGGK